MTRLRLRGSHALRRAFPDPSPHSVTDYGCPATPPGPEPWRFGLCPVRSPLLGVSLLFSLPAGTRMFRFPAFAPANWWPVSLLMGCPIRTPADQRLLAPPRGVSPLAASFLASWSLGIHRPPLLSFPFSARHSCLAAFSYLFLYSLQNVNGLFLPLAGDSPRGLLRGGSPVSFPSPFGEGSATGGILYFLVENKGVEPLTPCLQGRCSKPTELIPRSPVQS